MKSRIAFKCVRCSKCCSNLLLRDGRAGLMVHEDEKYLFKDNIVKPCLAIGTYPKDRNFEIITYQLTVNICPHLNNNLCMIYDNRPLICRGYPIQIHEKQLEEFEFAMAPECRTIQKLKRQYDENIEVEFNQGEHIEMKNSMRKLRRFWILPDISIRQWVYNLKTDKWELYKQRHKI